MIDYEIHVEDPDTFTKPCTIRMTVTAQPGYEIYEYGCHEGNNAMRNALSAERAYEKAAAEAAGQGPAAARARVRTSERRGPGSLVLVVRFLGSSVSLTD